jgi:hypothetical protein
MPSGSERDDVIAGLIAGMRDDEGERRRRWPAHPAMREWAHERALEWRLFVPAPHWFHEVSLDARGDVVVRLDTERGFGHERPANAREAHITWQRHVPAGWPELAAFVPPRPADAVVCDVCAGTGHLPLDESALILCPCGGVGWVPHEAATVEAFVDWAPVTPKPRRWWQRWLAPRG